MLLLLELPLAVTVTADVAGTIFVTTEPEASVSFWPSALVASTTSVAGCPFAWVTVTNSVTGCPLASVTT